ncbi:MAG: hypothetical protein HOP32_00815 [Nitrospira sp.]|nr:hypothetical protein [Nitrospira sp.]
MINQLAKTLLLTAFFVFAILSAASAEFHGHPDLEEKAEHITRISLLQPQIDMFEIGAGNSIERMEEWSQTARTHTRNAIKEEFAKREHLKLKEFDERKLSGTARPTYDETFLLYDVVSNAILTHSFTLPNAHSTVQTLFFPWKARDFTYSLGREMEMLATDVDAFLLVWGIDQRSSGGRKALGVGTAIIGAALGVAVVPQRGANLFTAALVDAHTGDILWFSKSIASYDLRESQEATKLILEFMTDLPALGRFAKPQ